MMKFIRSALALLALCAPACAQVQSGFPSANQVYAGPASGPAAQPTFRALTNADLPGGINTRTTAYAAQTSDCGKTVTLGGAAFYALTVGAASGFPAGCLISVANTDTGRGKTMTINGVTFPNGGFLWPLQTTAIVNAANSWVVLNAPGRWKLTGNIQFEVDAAGSNANDGLATGATGAFQTINGAMAVLANILDVNGNGVTLHTKCTGGPQVTYTGSIRALPLVGQPIGNNPSVNLNPILSGDTTTPSNCVLTSANGATFQAIGGTYWNLQGFQLKNTDGSSPCILADQQSWIRFANLDFNSCNGASGNHIVVENLSGAEATGNYTISAGASSHVYATLQGEFVYAGGTITLTGTPAFTAFAHVERNSMQLWSGATFSGAATGPRFNSSLGGGIETSGGGLNFLPGNSAGSAVNPGWYN